MDYPLDEDYVCPETETSDIDYDPGRTTQLQIDEHPADKTEDFDPYDRDHLEFDSQEVSVAATEIETFDVDNPAKWKRIRDINAGVDGHRGREDSRQKVDRNKLDKRRTAETVACQFGLRGRQKTVMVAWVVNSDLRGYSRHHGGRLGASCAEACYQLFKTEYEALDCEWVADKITEMTSGTKVVTEVYEDGDLDDIEDEIGGERCVVTELEDDDDHDAKVECLKEETPVEPRGLLLYHWDRRR